ncbi:hypothetical protein F5I97DRAFT_1931015 [Phlebopus sp. FC_14]|nr:hypothetical protein F5I97DRAFT_1931015 [Phlebopus sp. FC_14]
MSELDLLRESLRSVQQERDRYRSETARLRTDNAKLQNDIDVLLTRLSDLGAGQAGVVAGRPVTARDESMIEEWSDDGGRSGQTRVSTNSKRARSPLVGEHSRDAKKSRMGGKTASSKARGKIPPKSAKNDGHPASGANAAPLNEGAAVVRYQNLTTAGARGIQTNGYVQETGANNLASIANSTPDTVSPEVPRSYKFYDKIPAQCLVLPLQKIAAYLNEASACATPSPPSPVHVSRTFISQNTCSHRGGVAKLRFPTRSDCRYDLISSHSAYFPISFGSPGLFMSCFKELFGADPSSRLWTCLAWTPNLMSKEAVYVGEYRLRSVGVMSVEDYQDQKEQAKAQVASLLASCQNPKKGEKKTKSFFEDACKASAEAFAKGEEKINVFLMECVEYDAQFASSLRDRFESWTTGQRLNANAATKQPNVDEVGAEQGVTII